MKVLVVMFSLQPQVRGVSVLPLPSLPLHESPDQQGEDAGGTRPD